MRVLTKAMLILAACTAWLADDTRAGSLAAQPAVQGRSAASDPQIFAAKLRPYRPLDTDHVLHLIGMSVENEDGQPVGNLEDFIVDQRSGQLAYALVSSGGFLGWHKQFRILPPQLLSSATAKRDVLELDVGPFRWQRAPRFRYRELTFLGKPDQERRIYDYYNQSPAGLAHSTLLPARNSVPWATGREVSRAEGTYSAKRGLQFASQIIGKPLTNPKQQFVGTLSDLLVDLKGQRPVLALISPGEFFPGQGSFAVALRILEPDGAESFVINATRKMFADAPCLDEQSWLAMDNSGAAVICRSGDHGASGTNPIASERSQHEVARQF